jgi:tetratricopeptide (TPR) repeat protein
MCSALYTWSKLVNLLDEKQALLSVSLPIIVIWVLESHSGSALNSDWLDYVDNFVAKPSQPSGSTTTQKRFLTIRCLEDMKCSWDWLDPSFNFLVRLTRHACDTTLVRSVLSAPIMIELIHASVLCFLSLELREHADQLLFFCEPTARKLRDDDTTLPWESLFGVSLRAQTPPLSRYSVAERNREEEEAVVSTFSSSVADMGQAIQRSRASLRYQPTVTVPAYLKKRKLSDVESLFVAAGNDISPEAGIAALEFVHEPSNMACANKLSAVLSASSVSRYGSVETLMPVQRLYTVYSNSVPLCLWGAHELFGRKKYQDMMERYIDAFKLDPSQPLSALCLANALLYFAKNSTFVKKKHLVLLKSFACFHRYRALRLLNDSSGRLQSIAYDADLPPENKAIGLDQFECSIAQEVLHNFGRFYQEVHLNHLAEKIYCKILTLESMRPKMRPGLLAGSTVASVVKETAHNLAIIYRNSGANDLAFEVMREYLTY